MDSLRKFMNHPLYYYTKWKFTSRSFNGSVGGTWRNLVPLSKQFEMMNQCLHRGLERKIKVSPSRESQICGIPLNLKIKAIFTFISPLEGGHNLWSSVFISPGGILFMHCSIIRRDCLISSTRHKYLKLSQYSIIRIIEWTNDSFQSNEP